MDKKFYEELGIIIQDERIKKRLTQQELATKIGKTRNCIANWENGRRTIDIVELCKLCSAMGIDVNELLSKVKKYVN